MLLGISITGEVFAQSYDYNNLHFRQYNVLQGMPSDACTKIYKDSYGFLWVSTYYGISIFNGNQFTNLPVYSSKENYYLGDFPYTFLQLNKDTMLISCSNGLYVFNYRTKDISKLPARLLTRPRTRIFIVGFNSKQYKIAVKVGSTVYYFNKALKQLDSANCWNENNEVLVTNEFTGSYCFYYTRGEHLASLDMDSGKIDSTIYLPGQKSDVIINCQSPKRYVVATSSVIYTFDAYTRKNINNTPLPQKPGGLLFLPQCIKIDSVGNCWVAGRADLFIYFPNTNNITRAKTLFTDSVSNKTIIAIDVLIDKDALFVSTINNGLLKYDNRYVNFEDYYFPASSNSSVYSMVKQGDDMFSCSNTGGLTVDKIKDGSENNIKTIPYKYGDIVQMEKLDDKNIWLLFRENFKLAIVSSENYLLKDTLFSIDSLAQARFKAINARFPRIDLQPSIKRANASLYYYTIKNFLYRIEGNMQSGFHFSLIDSLPAASNISAIGLSAKKQVVLGTSDMELYALEGNKLIKKSSPPFPMHLPAKSIDIDEAGNVYVLTINGLYIYNHDFHLAKHLEESDTKMLNNILYASSIDKRGTLWMSANAGIISYDTKTGKVYNFPSAKLFHGREFNSKSVYQDSIGNIYFGGTNGITVVHSNLFSSGTSGNKLYFEKIKNFDSVLLNGMLPGSFDAEKSFAYNKNTFSFSIGSVSYRQLEEVSYKYMLEGFDTVWSLPNNNNSITYINLPPGKYKFKVKETYSGDEAGPEISYSFTIDKPYWKTAWFVIFMFVSGACLVSFILKYIMDKRLEKQRLLVTKQLVQRNERERISQELHDDLGSGLTSIRLLSKSVIAKQQNGGNVSNMLESIGKISGELIDQMSEIIWLMNHMDDTLNGLLAHLRIYMADYLHRTGIPLQLHFENSIKDDYEITGVQRRNILLVVKEAFNNVVKHSKATDFFIQCSSADKRVNIIISDNGIGLPKEITLNGNGLNNMKKRIGAVGGTIRFESNNGTRIFIELPKQA
ncbi:MAG TPA: triple tyrosine motif-containing protein [Puia sp.]|nr:triple tyrosine motif-containing protein [Puia sp.]